MPITPSTPDPTSSTLPSGIDASPTEIAVADLAERLGIEPPAIEVVSMEEVTWPDGALGCPEPGRMYTQALVGGLRIVLRAAGADHEYHSGTRRGPFYCPPLRIQSPVGTGDPSI